MSIHPVNAIATPQSAYHGSGSPHLSIAQPPISTSVKRKVSLATGYAAYPLIKEMADKISELCPGVETEVFRIKNDFFGESVTVAGLVCGVDLLTQLRGKDLGDRLIIPSVMLRDEKDRFLDDMTLSSLEDALNEKIVCADASGADFISAILDN